MLGGCAAKQKAVSVYDPSETTATAGKPLASEDPKMARESSPNLVANEDYERAVADYNNCILDHTTDLSACEKQRSIMNGKALSRPSLKPETKKIINIEQ